MLALSDSPLDPRSEAEVRALVSSLAAVHARVSELDSVFQSLMPPPHSILALRQGFTAYEQELRKLRSVAERCLAAGSVFLELPIARNRDRFGKWEAGFAARTRVLVQLEGAIDRVSEHFVGMLERRHHAVLQSDLLRRRPVGAAATAGAVTVVVAAAAATTTTNAAAVVVEAAPEAVSATGADEAEDVKTEEVKEGAEGGGEDDKQVVEASPPPPPPSSSSSSLSLSLSPTAPLSPIDRCLSNVDAALQAVHAAFVSLRAAAARHFVDDHASDPHNGARLAGNGDPASLASARDDVEGELAAVQRSMDGVESLLQEVGETLAREDTHMRVAGLWTDCVVLAASSSDSPLLRDVQATLETALARAWAGPRGLVLTDVPHVRQMLVQIRNELDGVKCWGRRAPCSPPAAAAVATDSNSSTATAATSTSSSSSDLTVVVPMEQLVSDVAGAIARLSELRRHVGTTSKLIDIERCMLEDAVRQETTRRMELQSYLPAVAALVDSVAARLASSPVWRDPAAAEAASAAEAQAAVDCGPAPASAPVGVAVAAAEREAEAAVVAGALTSVPALVERVDAMRKELALLETVLATGAEIPVLVSSYALQRHVDGE